MSTFIYLRLLFRDQIVNTYQVGAVADALAGKGIANAVDPVAEDAYRRDHYSRMGTRQARNSRRSAARE